MPNAAMAIVEREKVTQYLLNPHHPLGASKERFFARFGFGIDSWELLREALLQHGRTHPVARETHTDFGVRFEIDGELDTPSGRRPILRTVWQRDVGRIAPRLITAYPAGSP